MEEQVVVKASREFQIFAKPVGAICNLDCHYCYYLQTLVSAKSGSFPLSKAVGREGADAFLTPMPLHTLGQMHCHRRLFP